MTNYEKYKTEIDIILDKNTFVAVDRNTNKLATCRNLSCEDCLFFRKHNDGTNCDVNAFKWLVAEYKEPEIDWSKVPIDTPVLISGDGKEWYRRYFSGVDENGSPTVFCCGTTRWSSKNYDENENTWNVNHIKLAEVEE
jgi:hypothetical protein